MPLFTTEPPELPDGFVFRIVRTPADRPFQAIVTCIEPVGSNTHFANNRTIPCEGYDACPLCQDGFSKRWHGYVSCLVPTTLEHCLFEFTAHAADSFKNYIDLHSTIRACVFRAFRPSKRHNGRVIIHTTPGDEAKIRLPDPPDIQRLLCHIWNVKYNQPPKRMSRPPFKCIDVEDGNGRDGRYRATNDPAG